MIYEPLAPVRLLEDLRERGRRWIAIDRESYEAMGCNILAVRPGVVVMVDGVARRAARARARGRRGPRLRRLGAVAQGRRRADLPDRAVAARSDRARSGHNARLEALTVGGDLMAGRRKMTIAAALTALLALAALPVWTDAKRQQARGGGDGHRTARNVIVLQGDGMATAQRDLIRLVTPATSRARSSS